MHFMNATANLVNSYRFRNILLLLLSLCPKLTLLCVVMMTTILTNSSVLLLVLCHVRNCQQCVVDKRCTRIHTIYSRRKNNRHKIYPAHSMITKLGFF